MYWFLKDKRCSYTKERKKEAKLLVQSHRAISRAVFCFFFFGLSLGLNRLAQTLFLSSFPVVKISRYNFFMLKAKVFWVTNGTNISKKKMIYIF